MENSTRQIGILINGLLIGLGVIVLIVGIIGVFDFDGMGIASVLLLASGILIVVGSFVSMKKNIQNQQVESRLLEKMETAARLEKAEGKKTEPVFFQENYEEKATEDEDWIFIWNYNVQEWEQFRKAETKKLWNDNWVVMIILVIVGTFILRWAEAAPLVYAFLISLVFGFVFSGLKVWFAISRLIVSTNKQASATITPKGMKVNQKFFAWQNGQTLLNYIKIVTLADQDCLEFKLTWDGSRGSKHSDEVRIPIPSGKREEANELISRLSFGLDN